MKSYLSLIPISAKVTQTAKSYDDFVHCICGVSGHSSVQYGRYGDSDGIHFLRLPHR